MLYAIHAFEQMYEGLHGIEDYAVIECLDETEASEIGWDMAKQVIDNYSYTLGLDDDEKFNDYLENGGEYEIWQVRETNKTLEELNDMFFNNPEDFIKEYCIEI